LIETAGGNREDRPSRPEVFPDPFSYQRRATETIQIGDVRSGERNQRVAIRQRLKNC
jgi:hypothetical protein